MKRELEKFLSISNLNDITLIDNTNTIWNKSNDWQIVSDKQVWYSSFLLELLKKVKNLRSDWNIKSWNKFLRMKAGDLYKI